MVTFYRDVVYPAIVERLGNPAVIQRLRREVVANARGTVLEVGFGAGANCAYYDASKVTRLYALEPNVGMRRRAQRQLRTDVDVQFLALPGERIPLDDASVDTIVSTFTLCTIGPVHEALRELGRVIKSGGALLFLENSIAPDLRVRTWQRRWEPIHHRVFSGLSLTRDIPALLEDAGFHIERLDCSYLSRFPKSWSHCCRGIVTKPSGPLSEGVKRPGLWSAPSET